MLFTTQNFQVTSKALIDGLIANPAAIPSIIAVVIRQSSCFEKINRMWLMDVKKNTPLDKHSYKRIAKTFFGVENNLRNTSTIISDDIKVEKGKWSSNAHG